MRRRYYIAYGSNLNVGQMKFRCPTARIIGTAIIKDYELLFKGSKTGSYLTIEKKKGEEVPVVIWETQESDEQALDRYEGCPQFYYKKEMIIPIKEAITERGLDAGLLVCYKNTIKSLVDRDLKICKTTIDIYNHLM